jgi:hypothetical protein
MIAIHRLAASSVSALNSKDTSSSETIWKVYDRPRSVRPNCSRWLVNSTAPIGWYSWNSRKNSLEVLHFLLRYLQIPIYKSTNSCSGVGKTNGESISSSDCPTRFHCISTDSQHKGRTWTPFLTSRSQQYERPEITLLINQPLSF